MGAETFASTSILVAFLGGMVMLFAPCCISLMLPAYLGTVFKSRTKVLLMTLIFAAGVATVILPLVLGARALASFFTANHTAVFTVGSLVLIGAGLLSLFNVSLKIPFVSRLRAPRVTNAASAYLLGVVSGVSSSCCAPVLIGALALSAVSPTVAQALAVGLAYTLGIVFPLLVLSVLFERRVLNAGLRLQAKKLRFGGLTVPLWNFLAFVILAGAGLVMLVLALTNRLAMDVGSDQVTVQLNVLINTLTAPLKGIPFIDVALGVLLVGFVVYLARRAARPPAGRSKGESKRKPKGKSHGCH